MKIWRFGNPETAIELDEEDGCPACAAAGNTAENGDVIFIEYATGEIRRVEQLPFGILGCQAVSAADARAELEAYSIEPTAGWGR